MEPKIRYSKAMDKIIGTNRYFTVSVTNELKGGVSVRHYEIWMKEGDKKVVILPYDNLNSHYRASSQFKETCRVAELNLALFGESSPERKENKIESTGNGEFITIKFADGKSTFLQGEDAACLRAYFKGEVPTFAELYTAKMADQYHDLAR
jgi:hypothetical protein